MLTRGLERHIPGRSSPARVHPLLLVATAVALFLASFLVGTADGGTGSAAVLGRPAAASPAPVPATSQMRFPGVPGIDLVEMGYAGIDLDQVTSDWLLAPLPSFPMQQATELRGRIEAGFQHLDGLWAAEQILYDTFRADQRRVADAKAALEQTVVELDAARAAATGTPMPSGDGVSEAGARERHAQLLVGMSPQELAVADVEIAVAAAEQRLAEARERVGDHKWAFEHTAWSVDETVTLLDHLYAQLGAAQGAMRTAGTALAESERGRDGIELKRVAGFQVHHGIADSLEDMVAAARADGIDLRGNGFRSTDRQIELREQNCGPTQYDIFEKPSGLCSPPTAKPHRSLHETGLAVDFRHGEEGISSRRSPAYQWLAANAHAYGFFNLPSEPWHWSTSGT